VTQAEGITPLGHVRLMVATPVYDGAQGSYLNSALALARMSEESGMECGFALLSHQPSINRARNTLLHMFIRSNYTHMLFIDADIGFDPAQVLDMLRLMCSNKDYAIMGAPCPKRQHNWASIAAAAKKGLADDNPSDLQKFGGVFAIDLADKNSGFKLNEPVELAKLGTGLMAIRRDVVEALLKHHPELAYLPNEMELQDPNIGDELHALFQPMIDPDTKTLLSDDYAFCRRARDAGFKIWMAPWMRTSHTGPAKFSSALADLAPLYSTNSTPTN